MLRSINEILGYTILATDGDIGRCHGFLFDDRTWIIRYMVAKTAKWLPGRKVIITPSFLDKPDWINQRLPTRLTRQQIEESPSLDEHAPVSRRYELAYHKYYALPFYWVGEAWRTYPAPFSGVIYPVPDQPLSKEAIEEEHKIAEKTGASESELRSIKEVIGYQIAAVDGEIGHVEDFLIEDDSWTLRYLVVETRNWLPGRKVLVSLQWITSIQWIDEKVHVDLTVEAIKNSPEFDPSQPVNRQHEIVLYDYYGRPYYWN